MRPKVIMHAQTSLDGRIRGFDDTGIYYAVAARFNEDMALVGSETMYTAVAEYPPETEKDFVKPAADPDDRRMLCVVPDSRGRLNNLHVFRGSQYSRDVIVLVSASTPESHLEYLRARDYDFIVAGEDRVDLEKALEILYESYGCQTIRTDSGGALTSALLQRGLVDEISLVVSPCLVGTDAPHLFRSLSLPRRMELELTANEIVDGHLCLIYRVL